MEITWSRDGSWRFSIADTRQTRPGWQRRIERVGGGRRAKNPACGAHGMQASVGKLLAGWQTAVLRESPGCIFDGLQEVATTRLPYVTPPRASEPLLRAPMGHRPRRFWLDADPKQSTTRLSFAAHIFCEPQLSSTLPPPRVARLDISAAHFSAANLDGQFCYHGLLFLALYSPSASAFCTFTARLSPFQVSCSPIARQYRNKHTAISTER